MTDRHVDTIDTTHHMLTQIDQYLRWTYADAYQPEGPRTRKATTRIPDPDADPDHVPADTTDFGIGNHHRRNAWREAIAGRHGDDHHTHGGLTRIEIHLAYTVHLTGGQQPALGRPQPHHDLPVVLRAVELDQRRLNIIRLRWPRLHTDDIHTATHHLDTAHHQARDALVALERAWQEGRADPNTQAVAHRCRNANRGCPNLATGGRARCWGCHRWWQDHGQEKPTRLLAVDLGTAVTAQARRTQRGDGWGDESASCTTPLRKADPA